MPSQYQSLSDEDLARQAQAGSLSAFDELVMRYHRRIYAFVAQSCSNATDAAEITQDTFVKSFQAIATFNPCRPFGAWLFAIARHKCIDHHRAAPPFADAPMPDLPDARTPADQLVREEEQQSLWALARRLLPAAQFQALWLKYAEEMSVQSIAQVLGKTQTHIKVLLFRARRALARELDSAPGAETAAIERTQRAAPVCVRPVGVPVAIGKESL